MKKFIPQFLKYPLIALYVLSICLLRGRGAKDKIVTNLAGVLPRPGRIVHGGKVKLLHIREKFGESWRNFNIAYFASSGLPFAPQIWLKLYKFFGVKTVWNQNGLAYPALYTQEVVDRINNILKPIHLSDFVVYQTEFTKRCSDKFIGAFKGPHEIIINPVDTDKFKPASSPLPAEPLVVIMSGHHFESAERMKVSIEALKQVRETIDLKLIVIGKTDIAIEEPWAEKVGSYTQEEAPTIYQKAHMLLHLKYLDPCPTIVLEALAAGLPVVGQANGGMPEMVSSEAGILLPVQEDFERLHYPSVGAVAEAILKVRETLPQYSQAARKQALKFDKKIWLEKHETIFNNLLK